MCACGARGEVSESAKRGRQVLLTVVGEERDTSSDHESRHPRIRTSPTIATTLALSLSQNQEYQRIHFLFLFFRRLSASVSGTGLYCTVIPSPKRRDTQTPLATSPPSFRGEGGAHGAGLGWAGLGSVFPRISVV